MKIPIVSGFLTRLKSGFSVAQSQNDVHSLNNKATWEDESLDLAVGTLLADKQSKSYGIVQAITLSQFKEDLGALWDQHEKSILLIAETTIYRMLRKGQTAIQEDEYSWLLVMPDLDKAAGAAFAEHIASIIGEKLVGARFDDDDELDPTPQTGAVDLSSALSEDGSINKDAINRAVAEARAIIAQRNRRLKQTERSQTSKTTTSSGQSPPKPRAQTSASGGATAEKGLKLVYWPMWSADSQAIDMFVCRPQTSDGADPFSRTDPALIAANAVSVARACTVALNSMIKDGVRAKLVVPIPLSAVLSPHQRLIFQALEKLQEAHRFLYLRTEIVSVPKSVSTTALLTARDFFKPLARDVSILTDLHEPNKAVLAAGKVVIGCDTSAKTSITSSEMNKKLSAFKGLVRDRTSYVLGLTETCDLQAAIKSGFDEVGGPGLRPLIRSTPNKTEPLLRDDIV